jgi:predicted RNA-binding protein associated with RNAse of E/G family
MKRRFAYSPDETGTEYVLKRIDKDYFEGYVCQLKMIDVKPLIVKLNNEDLCLRGNGYTWYEIYPDNENYVITIMYDSNNMLVEWYFDISKELGIENGIPYEDDLYLDLSIRSNDEVSILDEEELKEALNNNIISKQDYNFAYEVLDKLQREYVSNFDHLVALTEKLIKEFE